jgi:hypothetical protein
MIMTVTAVSDATIERVLSDPPLIWQVIHPGMPAPIPAIEQKTPPFLGKLFGKPQPEETPEPAAATLVLGEDEMDTLDLDKAWHILHFMLGNDVWDGNPPLNFILLGGEDVGKIDVGYGPARAMRSGDVQIAKEALDKVSDDEIRSRFDPSAEGMSEVYPNGWHEPDPTGQGLQYILDNMASLREFLATTARRRHGLIFALG